MKRAALASAVILLAFPLAEAAGQQRGAVPRGGGGGSRGGGAWHGGGGGPRGGGAWHGGGGPRGGGYPGGYHRTPHAVPRSGYGHLPQRGGAYARHPRAGTGSYGYGYHHGYGYGYGYGGYRGHHHGHYYGGYYRPYYYPYYRPWYGSFYWGWPYYAAPGFSIGLSYGPAYVSGAYVPAPGYSVVTPGTDPSGTGPAEPAGAWGRVRLEVRPEDASVYVDDTFYGTAREARTLRLAPGRHTIELVRPGFAVERHEVEVVEGESVDVLVEMLPVRPSA